MSAAEAVSVTARRTSAIYGVEVRRDVRIPTADPGSSLSADLFLPVGADLVPALLTLLPYRKDAGAGIANDDALRWFAARGYASVLVDFRGTGSSDGLQRPPFDPDEADDGVTAVDWAANQPWCDGNVGMWGHSYGAVMALRTASRQPPRLKAIMPVMGMTDPGPDFVHPSGQRGCLASLADWGTATLLNQLLPPVHDFDSPAEQQRWQDRLYSMEPWLLDLFRHGPDDPVWEARAIDVTRIAVPTFCVAGWRDLFCDSTIRVFERIRAPKKLLAGPWMHTMPDTSPFLHIDFLPLALRWWRHWLGGVDTGFLDEPPVTAYRQGSPGGWERFGSWPPPHHEHRLVTGADTELRPSNDSVPAGRVIAEGVPDPTVGALGGLWGIPTTGFGLPLDQHDDDLRSLTFTSAVLEHDLPIAGRPAVAVWTEPDTGSQSLVVRVTDVDQQGRSILVSSGVTGESRTPDPAHQAELTPTYYVIPAGHRVRVVVSGADFPRLWPAPRPKTLRVTGVEARLPVAVGGQRDDVAMPTPSAPASKPGYEEPMWKVTRDLVGDGVTVTVGEELAAAAPSGRHCIELRRELSATVSRDEATGTLVRGVSAAKVDLANGATVDVKVDLRLTDTAVVATGRVDIDGGPVFLRRWEAGRE